MQLRLHPKQTIAYVSPATEILYGGAASGGKSHLMRVIAISIAIEVPGIQIYLFRREYPDLKKNHFEGPTSFMSLLADWILAGVVKFNVTEMSITFSNGSKIHACHCQHEKDVYGYQGAEIHVLLMDELTHFTEFQYRFLRGRCRVSGLDVPERCRWSFPKIICGTNPGGVGHNWVKATFIDKAPPLTVFTASDEDGGMVRQFIPALLADNPTIDADKYRKALMGLGNPHLIKAMLDGSWDIVAGGMFDDVWQPDKQVIPHFKVPNGWHITRCFDWGSSKPFAVIWVAEADGTMVPETKFCPPKGSLICIGEWYGWNGRPDDGARMTAIDIGKGIVEREKQMGIVVQSGPADSAIFAHSNGTSIADEMARVGAEFEACEKGPGSRVTGWTKVRTMLAESAKDIPEAPGLWLVDSCRHGIRTLPTLPRDDRKQEDVDTAAEDHWADAVRYRCTWSQRAAGGVKLPGF